MIYHKGNKTIYPEDKCWTCSNSIDCSKLGQLGGLVEAFNEEVQFSIAQCDGYEGVDLTEDETLTEFETSQRRKEDDNE